MCITNIYAIIVPFPKKKYYGDFFDSLLAYKLSSTLSSHIIPLLNIQAESKKFGI